MSRSLAVLFENPAMAMTNIWSESSLLYFLHLIDVEKSFEVIFIILSLPLSWDPYCCTTAEQVICVCAWWGGRIETHETCTSNIHYLSIYLHFTVIFFVTGGTVVVCCTWRPCLRTSRCPWMSWDTSYRRSSVCSGTWTCRSFLHSSISCCCYLQRYRAYPN